MHLTFRGHACFSLIEDGAELLVDPGTFTPSLPDLDPAAVVVSHVHPDHLDPMKIDRLVAAHPALPLFAPSEVRSVTDHDVRGIDGDQSVTIGPFRIGFFCGAHAEILSGAPRPDNLGIRVNHRFFYPGDALTRTDDVDILAVPVSAPWLRIDDVRALVDDIRPSTIVPVHTAVLSPAGRTLTLGLVNQIATGVGARVLDLEPGETVDLGR